MAEFPHSLIDGLTLLSDALDDPITDLRSVLSVLTDDLTAAIPCYLGLTITLHVDDSPVTVNTVEVADVVKIRSSVLLPLLPLGEATAKGSVAFYSGTPGAFIDLADDARWIFNLTGPPVLDDYLTSTGHHEPPGIRGLPALSELNQAVGALVEEGHSQQDAQNELRRRANLKGQTLQEAARELLNALPRPGAGTKGTP